MTLLGVAIVISLVSGMRYLDLAEGTVSVAMKLEMNWASSQEIGKTAARSSVVVAVVD